MGSLFLFIFLIIMIKYVNILYVRGSSKGRTSSFGLENWGSSPYPRANLVRGLKDRSASKIA